MTWSEIGLDPNGTTFSPCFFVVVGNAIVYGEQTKGHIAVVTTRPQCTPVQNAGQQCGTMAVMNFKAHSFDAVMICCPARMIFGVFAQ